ncbi:MAG: hypothetical protein ACE5HD_05860 [Acidobacteriota bacterium]
MNRFRLRLRRGSLLGILFFLLPQGGAALLPDHLAFTSGEKLAAALPYLSTSDHEQRKVLFDLLSTIDRARGDGVDFTFYAAALKEGQPEPLAPLIAYMYAVAPGEALRTVVGVYGKSRPGGRSVLERMEAVRGR